MCECTEYRTAKQLRDLTSQAARTGLGDSATRVVGPYSIGSRTVYLVTLPIVSEVHKDLVSHHSVLRSLPVMPVKCNCAPMN